MANGIQPSGYYTTAPELGGGKADSFQYLLDPDDPAGAYRRLLQGNLYPSDVGDYSNITSSGALSSGPFNLIPTPEGLTIGAAGLVNPLGAFAARGASKRSNSDALRTLANAGILEVIKPSEDASGFNKFLGYTTNPSGEYRLSKEVEDAITQQGITPKEYFQNQDAEQFGDARDLAQYLDQIAYTTQGNFFTKDLFGNPTPWSKYVDRNGNIKPDALENWKQFGSQDKRGALNMFDSKEDQGTQPDSADKGFTFGEGYIGSPTEQQTSPTAFMSQLSTDGGIEDLPAAGTGRSGPPGFTPNSEKQSGVNRSGVTFNTPLSQVNRIAASVARDPGSFNKSKGFFDRGR